MAYWLRRCVKFGWPMTLIMILVSVALVGFWALATDVVARQAFGFDAAILNALFAARSSLLTAVMLAFTTSGSFAFVAATVVLITVFWWRRSHADVYALWGAVICGVILNEILKQVFARPRPTLHPWLSSAAGWSFPSGHSTTALAFYGILAYLLARHLSTAWRYGVYVLAATWIVLVGLSRNYIGVHYPSDVLAAYAVTLPILIAVIVVHRCVTSPEHPLPPVTAGASPGETATSPVDPPPRA